jgi:hypothetical protein
VVYKEDVSDSRKLLDESQAREKAIMRLINDNHDKIYDLRFPNTTLTAKSEEEKKKFIRRCTRDGCQGFLSTAWKCGICEHYSCSKCFKPKTQKQGDPHECGKEDLETAELIKSDSKPCPNCGEFIMKSEGCSQMFCVSCQTPWDWNTGKVVTSGPIHNPHYYEWLNRNGGSVPRNPADVPCGGYPNVWTLRRFPRGLPYSICNIFYEFHRICQEVQDVSTRNYQSHIDNTLTSNINIKFLLGDFDEKRWGQLLAKQERKRKRDSEVQEIFTAFRMVAVELINRVQNYTDDRHRTISDLTIPEAQKILTDLDIEISEFIKMINEALYKVSICYSYTVPYIEKDGIYYTLKSKNYTSEAKKKRDIKDVKIGFDVPYCEYDDENSTVITDTVVEDTRLKNEVVTEKPPPRKRPQVAPSKELTTDFDEDTDLQAAIAASLEL